MKKQYFDKLIFFCITCSFPIFVGCTKYGTSMYGKSEIHSDIIQLLKRREAFNLVCILFLPINVVYGY